MTAAHLFKIGLHVLEFLVESPKAHELAGDPLAEGAHGHVLHMPQQVLHTHLSIGHHHPDIV